MDLKEFYYDLPKELIAQHPLSHRDHSRLLVLHKKDGSVEHKHFYDIIDYLSSGDCLVINDTKVIPARLFGEKCGSGGKIEFVLLRRLDIDHWEVMLKPGKRAKPGARFTFGNGKLTAEIERIIDGGLRIVKFYFDGVFEEILDQLGNMPLPPYITETLEDKTRYQTVYAKFDGSAAAPTAGLHFTPELLNKIRAKGIKVASLTLHVGLGTFRPVKEEKIEDHKMHSEYFILDEANAKINNDTKKRGGRVFAVGTTSTRTLESVVNEDGSVSPKSGFTDIFIYPPYQIKSIDALITNFHLPESTLLMLISAFADKDMIMNAYRQAIAEKYRFFSFGDSMLIL